MLAKHAFHSGKGDGPDSTFVKPSDWNADHEVTTTNASIWLGRNPSGPGAVEEFAVDHAASGDDFTMMTKAQVQAAIAAAVSALSVAETGDLSGSMRGGKTGWLLLNGQTIGNTGSTAIFANALAEALFTMFWNINGATWPVQDAAGAASRGASPNADWLALKKIPLPDARGCAIGMLDLAAGVNTLITALGVKVGAQNHTLLNTELANHTHETGSAGAQYSGNSSVGGLFTYMFNGFGGSTYGSGGSVPPGDPAAVPPYSAAKPHNNVQPTMGANIFIKL